MTQRFYEYAQWRQGIADFFYVPPCHFHAHNVVATRIPAENETISTTTASPIFLTPVGGIIAVVTVNAKIFHQHNLNSRSKLLHADFTCVDHEVVIVIISSNTWKLLYV
jgi:hypothetical protein